MKNRILCERYKKLKQSDRMEFLAINTLYENRNNTYDIIYYLTISLKVIIMTFLIMFIFISLIIFEEISFKDIANGMIEMPIWLFLSAFFISLFMSVVEIMVIILTFFNKKEWRKKLDEFLNEHS